MTFGEVLSEELDRRDMTAYKLSKESGVSRQYISALLLGKIAEPNLSKAADIAEALGMTVQDFIDRMG